MEPHFITKRETAWTDFVLCVVWVIYSFCLSLFYYYDSLLSRENGDLKVEFMYGFIYNIYFFFCCCCLSLTIKLFYFAKSRALQNMYSSNNVCPLHTTVNYSIPAYNPIAMNKRVLKNNINLRDYISRERRKFQSDMCPLL